jgi:hypothetical protein
VAFLEWLQHLPIFVTIAESGSIWGYPTILVLHTIGFALVVGSALVVNARLLGLGRLAPLSAFGLLFPIMWAGFTVNAISGFILFAIAATVKATQAIFWIKLSLVATALAVTVPIVRIVKAGEEHGAVPSRGRVLAVVSLVTWTGAIAAGRLMAYIK